MLVRGAWVLAVLCYWLRGGDTADMDDKMKERNNWPLPSQVGDFRGAVMLALRPDPKLDGVCVLHGPMG
jgi:hypothetical protein